MDGCPRVKTFAHFLSFRGSSAHLLEYQLKFQDRSTWREERIAPIPSNKEYYQTPAESSPFGYFFISLKRTTINLKAAGLGVELTKTTYEYHSSLLMSEDECAMF